MVQDKADVTDEVAVELIRAAPPPRLAWAIYYDSGARYGIEDGSWTDAPAEGVLLVVEKIGERVSMHSGADYYYLVDGECVAATEDHASILRMLGTPAGDVGPARGVKFGRWTTPRKMEQTFERARLEWR